MIVLNLRCAHGHPFDGWFGSADQCDAQQAQGLLACPVCGDKTISRLPSAPAVARSHTSPRAQPESRFAQALTQLRKLAQSADNVGERFPDEARRMHYGEIPERRIRGEASVNAVAALLDEGVPVLPLPAVVREIGH